MNADNTARTGLYSETIRIRGKNTRVPAVRIAGHPVIATGRLLRMASLFDEGLVEGNPVSDPALFTAQLKASGLPADIFAFTMKPLGRALPGSLYSEEDNLAVIRTDSHDRWWKGLRKKVRWQAGAAAKRGVVIKEVTFDDDLVRGIKGIYDETPIRQGRHFWHYGKDFEAVKVENATYLERSWFVGAFFEGELVGFLKIIRTGPTAELIQFLFKMEHRDKNLGTGLLSRAVELCEQRGVSLLIYSKYSYGQKGEDSLTDFKRRNGFEELKVARYYVPLTRRGRLGLRLGLHHGLANLLPKAAIGSIRSARASVLKLIQRPKPQPGHVRAEPEEALAGETPEKRR